MSNKWTMPEWMEPFRESICNTGGNSVEDMMNGHANPRVNLPLSTLQACVKSQVLLLENLRKRKILTLLLCLTLSGCSLHKKYSGCNPFPQTRGQDDACPQEVYDE